MNLILKKRKQKPVVSFIRQVSIFIDASFEHLIHLYTCPCITIPKRVFCMQLYDRVYDIRPFVKRRPEPESKRS